MKLFNYLTILLFLSLSASLSAQSEAVYITPSQTVVGDQVRVDFPVEDFDQIVCLQYTMNYDPNILQFDNIGNINLPDLGTGSFGAPEPGKITFSWLDLSTLGVTKPDGESIYSVFFSMAGGAGFSELYIDGSFTPVEACISTQVIPLYFNNINIASFVTSSKEIANASKVNVYPNPATDQVNFELSNLEGNVKIEVYNSLGKFIKTYDVENDVFALTKSSEINAGLYHYKVYSDKAIVNTGKFTFL